MTKDELRASIVAALKREHRNPAFLGGPGIDGVDEMWGFIADECIRQMEWAKRTTVNRFLTSEEWARRDKTLPLSPAPEGWKP